MNTLRLVLALASLLIGSFAVAGDLTGIERSISKEPRYESKVPKYCLLVLGPKAKTRIWLVLDGKTLYVDRNADGDLTAASERVDGKDGVFKVGELVDPVTGRNHTELVVNVDRRIERRPTIAAAEETITKNLDNTNAGIVASDAPQNQAAVGVGSASALR